MDNLKLSVSIILPGGILFTNDEAEQLEKEKAGMGFDLEKLMVEDDKGKKDILNIRTRKCRPCSQSINMSKEAYDYMISVDSCLPDIKSFTWAKMKPVQRLEAHLNLVCKTLNGISYTYKIFDD